MHSKPELAWQSTEGKKESVQHENRLWSQNVTAGGAGSPLNDCSQRSRGYTPRGAPALREEWLWAGFARAEWFLSCSWSPAGLSDRGSPGGLDGMFQAFRRKLRSS